MGRALSILPLAALITAALAAPRQDAAVDTVDFARDVRPILAARCFECHGAKKQKARLRLDRREAALAGAWDGEEPVILPGRGSESPLVRRTLGLGEDDRMPPKGPPLEPAQIETLRRWIDQGASWPEEELEADAGESTHWAYRTPQRPELPVVADEAWCRNELDRFVLARLEAEGLAPAPEAGRATLLRRVSLDLTGLPPDPAALAAFLADARPDAYERAVDGLLATTAYAEHMTRSWLDLARYADTNGYEKDERRSNWRWRDWVIEAFDRDLPFDQFTLRQFAGDLLEDAHESAVATGFHRNSMTNMEGGADPEEFRVAAVVDRVNTAASVWLGSTLACAQCHNHKYDPFSQKEYFELFAFFDSTSDVGNSNAPELRRPLPGQLEELARLGARAAELEAELRAPWPESDRERAAWEARMRLVAADPPAWTAALPRGLTAESGARLRCDAEGVVRVDGPDAEQDVYTLELEGLAGPVTALRLEALAEQDGGPGRASHANFVLTALEVFAGGSEPVPLRGATASYAQPGYPVANVIDGHPLSGWAVADQGKARAGEAWFVPGEPLEVGSQGRLRVVLRFESDHTRHTLGRLRLATTGDARAPEWFALPVEVRAALAADPSRRFLATLNVLEDFWKREFTERGRELVGRLEEATAARAEFEAAIPTSLVLQELPEPRETHVMVRGSFLARGERVEPDVPSVLNDWPEGAPRNRLGLARWLADPANPLTARVTVNRLWARCFGRGLVGTLDDFGTRGDEPTHPELLDWLAVEFVEGGWSVKGLLRELVTSATYRQSSRATGELLERDPQNLLLARAARPRLEAEVLRDSALAVSGLLDRTVGGASVFPPQPEGIWASTYSADRWETAEDGARWRRGMYTFLKRTAPYPSYLLFDGTSRELACTRRGSSNTPLQALTLLNDPVFVEAAQALARRVLLEAAPERAARIALAWRLALAREPEPAERELLADLLERQVARYRADPEAARALATSAVPLPIAELDTAELAAWTVAANVLLNLDEFVTRN